MCATCLTPLSRLFRYLRLLYERGINKAKRCLKERKIAQSRFSVDCYKSEKGFFMGAFTVAIALVSSVFFLYTVKGKNKTHTLLIYQITNLVLLVTALPVTIHAIRQMRRLKYQKSKFSGPDGMLLKITLMGVITLEAFEGVEGLYEKGVLLLVLRLLSSLLAISQSILQTYLVVDGENRHAHTEELLEEKPG